MLTHYIPPEWVDVLNLTREARERRQLGRAGARRAGVVDEDLFALVAGVVAGHLLRGLVGLRAADITNHGIAARRRLSVVHGSLPEVVVASSAPPG